jgi:hypothetical protein
MKSKSSQKPPVAAPKKEKKVPKKAEMVPEEEENININEEEVEQMEEEENKEDATLSAFIKKSTSKGDQVKRIRMLSMYIEIKNAKSYGLQI